MACFLAWPLTDRLGRKKALMLSAFVFAIGAIIQTINTHSLTAFYIARVIAGLGLGSATVVVPMFNSEMMPKELRGQIGSFFQWFYTFVRRDPSPFLTVPLLIVIGYLRVVLCRLWRVKGHLVKPVIAMADPDWPATRTRRFSRLRCSHSTREHAMAYEERPP